MDLMDIIGNTSDVLNIIVVILALISWIKRRDLKRIFNEIRLKINNIFKSRSDDPTKYPFPEKRK